MGWRTWREATQHALYGDGGFYRRTAGPAAHFRTSVHASRQFAEAVLSLARAADLTTVVDMGAGRGELLVALHALDPSLDLVGVELADRPPGLADEVRWTSAATGDLTALVVANEWLDNVPVDAVELAEDGPRLLEVDESGVERLGSQPAEPDRHWLDRWWPLAEVGDRAEVGRPRDEQWATVIAALHRGVAVAIDYSHHRDDRPAGGTLTGYRDGRQVHPVPDGTCDVTSHVALDACAAAGEAAGADETLLTTQRAALRTLGLRRHTPAHALATTDPPAYVAALSAAGQVAELTALDGLGGFGWLVQSVRTGLPDPLADLRSAAPLPGKHQRLANRPGHPVTRTDS